MMGRLFQREVPGSEKPDLGQEEFKKKDRRQFSAASTKEPT